jgi:protein ImuB
VLKSLTSADVGAYNREATVAIASGSFAAKQAALAKPGDPWVSTPAAHVNIVNAVDTQKFLGALAITRIANDRLAEVLAGLGVRTFAQFAALPEDAVLQRFGPAAAAAHHRARGLGEPGGVEVVDRALPRDLTVQVDFEPPLDGADQLAFAVASHAEAFVQSVASCGLVCTELLVELRDDTGSRHAHTWSHPANFTAADVTNRVRWQASSLPQDTERGGAGIAAIKLSPARTAPAAQHEPGLWNTAPDERVHHQFTRVQSLLGRERIGTPVLLGGRLSADRQALLPWADAAASLAGHTRPHAGPWPGALTGATPTHVFTEPFAVSLFGPTGRQVMIDSDDLLNETPTELLIPRSPTRKVHAWSAPWPLRETWWQAEPPAARFRLQVALEGGDAWLLCFTHHSGWAAEGRYA